MSNSIASIQSLLWLAAKHFERVATVSLLLLLLLQVSQLRLCLRRLARITWSLHTTIQEGFDAAMMDVVYKRCGLLCAMFYMWLCLGCFG
jgi:hypothetical protein